MSSSALRGIKGSADAATDSAAETAQAQEAEAAQWCYDYAEDGVKQGEAFLPSLAELEKLFANKAAINASLKALGVALLEGWYWSSTEYSSSYAWSLFMGSGLKYNYGKGNNHFYVRPVIKL